MEEDAKKNIKSPKSKANQKKKTTEVKKEKGIKKVTSKKKYETKVPRNITSKKEDIDTQEENLVTAIEKTMEREAHQAEPILKNEENIKYKEKEKKHTQWTFLLIWSLILAIVSVGLGSVVTFYALGGKNEVPQISYTSNKNIQKFIDVYSEILDKYYFELDEKALIEGAIKGMLEKTGDPHTSYFDKDSTEDFNAHMEGTYYGFGSEITSDLEGNAYFYTVFPNTPVEKAGIKVGDIIRAVNDERVDGKETADITQMMKCDGNTKKTISLTYERDKKEYTVKLTSEQITIPSVYHRVIESKGKKIGYIQITVFAANTAIQYIDALTALKKENVESLIVDVRDNSGGYLTTVDTILENTLPKGSIKYQIKSRDGIEKLVSKVGTSLNMPIVILQNVGSASGAEMLSIAYHDIYNAKIIGTTSYGKGTVQGVGVLSDGTMIKYTTKEWLSPNGVSIHEKGIETTIRVDLDKKYYETGKEEDDNQLQTAIRELTK